MRFILKNSWPIYFVIALAAITTLATMGAMGRAVWQMSEHFVPLAGSAQEIKSEASQFHLWFEEYIGGDKTVKLDDVWAYLNHAEWHVNAMLEGGFDEREIRPLEDEQFNLELKKALGSIHNLRLIGTQRLEKNDTGIIGSNLDQDFDTAYGEVLVAATTVERYLHLAIDKEVKSFQYIVYSLAALVVFVFIALAVLFYKFERAKAIAAEQINELAFYDLLTKLPNRRLLHDRIIQAKANSKRSSNYCALMYLDMDKFKQLNDSHGHNVGDLLLQEVSHRITRCIRAVDTASRIGGDEFVILISQLDQDKAESVSKASIIAEKIRDSLAEPYVLKYVNEDKVEITLTHNCSPSIGVVLFSNDEDSVEHIIKWADVGMYRAKDAGGNRFEFVEPST